MDLLGLDAEVYTESRAESHKGQTGKVGPEPKASPTDYNNEGL